MRVPGGDGTKVGGGQKIDAADGTTPKVSARPQLLVPLGPTQRAPQMFGGASFRYGALFRLRDASAGAALQALIGAGIPPSIASSGARRTTGLGITVPLMPPRPDLSISPEEYAKAPLADRARLATMKIAISADHGAYGRAEAAANYLRSLGVGRVVVIAPEEGTRMNYAVSTGAALSLLEAGEVDRVVSFCGNGLGALDIANLFSDAQPGAHRTRQPVYGDNFWTVVDGQRSDPPANVLCLGARLFNVDGDPMNAFLKAFLDAPANVDALAGDGAPRHGIASTLIDPKPERVKNRTLDDGHPFAGATIAEQIELTDRERKRIASTPVTIYYDPSSDQAAAQAAALKSWLPDTAQLVAWDGKTKPEPQKKDERSILLSENGALFSWTRALGFWVPEDEQGGDVHRAAHWQSVRWFVDAAAEGPLFLDLPASALANAVTGGADHDVLKLLSKVFLLTERRGPDAHKVLYGEAIEFTRGFLAKNELSPELEAWRPQLEDAKANARVF
jgi:hypothetical protein